MRKVLAGVVFMALAGMAGATTIMLNAVASNTISSVLDTHECSVLNFQIYSASGSTCTVKIEASAKSTGPFFDVTQQSAIVNPTATGEYWTCPKANFYRVETTGQSGGNVTVTIDAYTSTGSVCY